MLVLWIAWVACGAGCEAQQKPARGEAAPASRRNHAGAPPRAADQRRTRPLPAFEGRDLDGAPWRTAELLGQAHRRVRLRSRRAGGEARRARARGAWRANAAPQNFEIVGVAAGADADAARSSSRRSGSRSARSPIPGRSWRDASACGSRSGSLITDADGNLAFGEEFFPEEGPDPAGSRRAEPAQRSSGCPAGRTRASRALPLAPAFSAERLEGGARFELASLRGKPAILIFFLHTCPHCHEALRFLKQALAELPEASALRWWASRSRTAPGRCRRR